MKQHHHPNNNSRLCPPCQSPAFDEPSRVCDHQSVMEEVATGQSLVTQLRAIVLPALQADKCSELVAQMFQNVLDCSSKAMAELQLLGQFDDDRANDTKVDDKKRLRRIIPDDFNKEDVKPHHKHKRRRFADSISLETPVPHYDGHQWRKYGEKKINNKKYPRSYYRCTYKQEQDCKATKTVQQQDGSIGVDHQVMYTVVYHGQHTCKGNICSDSGIDDSETKTTVQSSSDSQSSISGNSLDPCDLDSNKLINKSADLIAENNMYEPFDMTASASMEFDSWELDVLLRFGAWCSFARACWNSIGLLPPSTNYALRAIQRFRRQLSVPFFIEVIILMSLSIWKCRNGWIFEDIPPTVENCRASFKKEILLVIHRANEDMGNHIHQWINQL